MERQHLFDVLGESSARYAAAVPEQLGAWALATAGLLALAIPVLRRRPLPPRVIQVGLAAVLLGGVVHAWQLRWLCDDAFISFRYARNLVDGLGLVFNEGARVEGYTNFLWTLILAVPIALGIHPGQAAIALGLASLAGACAMTALLVRHLRSTRDASTIPFAALLLAANYTFASYGTSGLETMFATLLVLVAVERAEAGVLWASGAAGIAATLAHPDHGIFYAVLGGLLFVRQAAARKQQSPAGSPRTSFAHRLLLRAGDGLHHIRAYAAPFFVVYVPYFIWRTAYYGDLFPNTYYAKSGDAWSVKQGLIYVIISGASAGLYAIAPLLLYGLLQLRRTVTAQLTAVAVPLYLLHVLKIGGDFMLGRLLCVTMPLLFIFAEIAVLELLAADCIKRRATGLLALPVLALAATPALIIEPDEKFHHVADERTFYLLRSFSPVSVRSDYTDQARALTAAFASATRPPVVGIGCVGIVGYETGLPTFDLWGLTEPSVAHMKIAERGRPGHEKLASVGHAIAGNADFMDIEAYPQPYAKHTELKIGRSEYFLTKYDTQLLVPLHENTLVSVRNFEDWLERWRAPRRHDSLACDAWFMSQFYFMHNERDRAQRIGRRALNSLGKQLPGGMLDWVVFGESPARAGFREVRRWSFNPPLAPTWTATGDAFRHTPRDEPTPGQALVYGHDGPFINSFVPKRGDSVVGTLASEPLVLQGDALTLKVGGGRDKNGLTVQLMIDGEAVESLTGCRSELMYRWAWDIRAHRGQHAQFVISDRATDGWGHILVDEIVEWTRDPTTVRRPVRASGRPPVLPRG